MLLTDPRSWAQVAVLLLPVPLIVTTNLAVRTGSEALRTLNQVLLIAIAAFVCVLGLLTALTAPPPAAGIGLLLTGLAGLAVQVPAAGARLERWTRFEAGNQVHLLALVLTVLLVGTQVTTQLTSDVLAAAAHGAQLTRTDLVLQELPFLVAALLGAGLLTRRPPAATLERLGFVRPAWWQVVLGLAAAGVFVAFGEGMDRLGQWLTPDLAHRVGEANNRIFGGLGDPSGVITIALAAGICEEALFRGALQPRLGLLWPAVVFASVHTQYGLSVDSAAVLILAVGLGLVRRHTNTTTATISHVTYNAVVGFGFARLGVVPAVAVELLLLAVLGGTWLRARRRAAPQMGFPAPGG